MSLSMTGVAVNLWLAVTFDLQWYDSMVTRCRLVNKPTSIFYLQLILSSKLNNIFAVFGNNKDGYTCVLSYTGRFLLIGKLLFSL